MQRRLECSDGTISYSQREAPLNGTGSQRIMPRKVRVAPSYDVSSKYLRSGGALPSSSLHSGSAAA